LGELFLQSISGREELPTFDRLWIDCTQEEIRLIARGVQDSPHDDNHALAFHTKKGGRNRKSFSQAFKGEKASSTSGYDHRKDKSKIQCFRCDKYGHFARDIAVGHKWPAWARQTLQEAEGHAALRGTFQESKKPKRFPSYVSTMSHIIDTEPSCHGEATS
jgi:hypothetical protein